MEIILDDYPLSIRPYLQGANVFDSSCSEQAKVVFSDKDCGYFIKSSTSDELRLEAIMTQYFYSLGLSAKVCEYLSDNDRKWLVTEKIHGNDGISSEYLNDPKRLVDIFANTLRELHSLDFSNCPVKNRTSNYLDTAQKNYLAGVCDKKILKERGFTSPEDAWNFVKTNRYLLKSDTLLHGDYCLPNVIFDGWKLSGFIDLGCGGVGDRHVDIFWGIKTLEYNLKTNAYAQRFIDVYGKDLVERDNLRLIEAIEIFG
ncbi:MAG: aminoglycoside 3'-phosphotransferase [Clostridia bacterium]|nr:aminoglycoside 3'-phosphotransferase [Clostridia bacterium]